MELDRALQEKKQFHWFINWKRTSTCIQITELQETMAPRRIDGVLVLGLLLVAKSVLWALEQVTDLLIGYKFTSGWREERRKAWLHHEHSAQLVHVVAKAHHIEVTTHSSKNFLYVHEKYVSPRYVLENKNVSLFTLDKTHVYFCVSDPDVDVYDTVKFPFVFMAHYTQAKKLVIMPWESFHRMADELGNPKVPVCLVNMTARCGSTLISQIMNRVPNVRSMSEPFALYKVSKFFRQGVFNYDQMRRMAQSCMRIHCKVEPDSNIERIVIKMTPNTSPMFVIFAELFPKFDLVFNTRHPKPSMLSVNKVMSSIKEFNLYMASKAYIFNMPYSTFPFPYKEKYFDMIGSVWSVIKKYNVEDVMVFIYGAVFITYLEAKNIYKYVVLYENLVSNPQEEVKKLFGVLGIPEKYVADSLEALKQDSQKSTFGKREDKPVISKEAWAKQNRILEELIPELSCNMSKEDFVALFK